MCLSLREDAPGAAVERDRPPHMTGERERDREGMNGGEHTEEERGARGVGGAHQTEPFSICHKSFLLGK